MLEFDKCYIVGTYVVNAGEKLKVGMINMFHGFRLSIRIQTLDEKKQWNTVFEAYVRDLDSKKPVIWTGDLNVAPTEKG
jgi:AP endonuclease 1